MAQRPCPIVALLAGLALPILPPAAGEDSPPILLQRPRPDPERRARLAAWWNRFQIARPALSVATARLRRARERWREGATGEGCRAARRALAEVDGTQLEGGPDYVAAVQVGTALDELAGATAACLERRYFELDYRLRLAEAALATAEKRVRKGLAGDGDVQ